MTKTDAIPRQRLSHHVLERLLAQINDGDFVPGDVLPPERQLMERFGVGRPAVREALQDLQRMGLVQIVHGDGARVLEPTAKAVIAQITGAARMLLSSSGENLEHLKEARIFFEVGLVRMAAARAQEPHLEAMRAHIEAQKAAGGDFADVLRADMAFHRQIAASLGNPVYAAVSEAMLAWLAEYHVGVMRQVGREAQTVAEHELILDRVEARDVEGAAAAMLMHLTRSSDLYRNDRA